ncbi:MAG: ABC transporter permease [Acidobacteriaceae bacterium]
MPLWSRIVNVFRGDTLNREIDEEFESHIAEGIEQGRDAAEVRKAFGSSLRQREQSHNIRVIAWLESLRADVIFGWRQIKRNNVTFAAAVLSLAFAMGACTSAFRLIEALFLRPLPITAPDRLYALSRQGIAPNGKSQIYDGWAYPPFLLMRDAVKGEAELIAVSYAERMDLTYKSDLEMEKAYVQYVSGWMFDSFGLRPALGRLLTENDDLKPGTHPYAVLSYAYWTSRFNRDPGVLGRTLQIGNTLFEIVGVGPKSFTGTEPGTVTDVFLPTMMHPWVSRPDADWIRTLVLVQPGVAIEPLRQKMDAVSQAFEAERAEGVIGMPKWVLRAWLTQKMLMDPAPAGVSFMQNDYRESLGGLGVLVALLLLIACANVANLMTALSAARAREMALRVSIGAGRGRLVQMVLVESVLVASLSAALGALFTWWSAPFIVGKINPPDRPAHLVLSTDWRVLGFGLALIFGVTLLLGLLPALRVSTLEPVSVLKGGENPHARRRSMHWMIAAQVAFCFLVVFIAGLFVATFQRLSNEYTGFSSQRLLALDTDTRQNQSPVAWEQMAERLRAVPGVERVALCQWPLLSGVSSNGFISINGAPPSDILTYFLGVSPGWLDTMKIPLIDGRDLRPEETSPGVAIVNETFAKTYFNGQDPVGKSFARSKGSVYRIVGLVHDARYRSIRGPMLPVAYVPFLSIGKDGALQSVGSSTFMVRTASTNPLALAPTLRRAVSQTNSEFRVSNIRTQKEIIESLTVRERLVAMLSLFFAGVALLLAGIGLYGVLNYSVLQRQREIGIRIAMGAQHATIARLVTTDIFSMILVGAVAGVALGLASVQYLETLFYQVKATDPVMLAIPLLAILAAAVLAASPAIIRALRINPAEILRSE